MKTLLERPNY